MTPARLVRVGTVVTLLLLVGAGGLWFASARWTPSRATYPVQGIDVQETNGSLDWLTLKSSGVAFAYVRATIGAGARDRLFAENWAAARAAGIGRGAYHVYSLCASAAAQAANFIALVPRDPEALPPAVELSFDADCRARPDRERLLPEIEAFIRMAEAHSERPVMLKPSRDFEAHYRLSETVDRPLWLASAYREPDYGAHPWVMWQASDRRRIDGASSPVGWNVVRPE